jgi:hypothetical protein
MRNDLMEAQEYWPELLAGLQQAIARVPDLNSCRISDISILTSAHIGVPDWLSWSSNGPESSLKRSSSDVIMGGADLRSGAPETDKHQSFCTQSTKDVIEDLESGMPETDRHQTQVNPI